MADPALVRIIAGAIEEQRHEALSRLELAAGSLADLIARLRYAPDVDPLLSRSTEAIGLLRHGVDAIELMASFSTDVAAMVLPVPQPAALIEPTDRVRRLDVLTERIAKQAETGCADFGALADICRNRATGTADDVVTLAASIRATADAVEASLKEAAEVVDCAGSA